MNESRYFKNNLKFIRRELKLEQQDLADALNRKSGSSVSDWERGKSVPGIKTLTQVAELYGVTVTQLMETDLTKKGDSLPSNVRRVMNTIRIPVLGTISCGDPITAIENIDEYREVSIEGLPNGELFILDARGDSMSPTIPDGATVICLAQPDVENGELAAVLLNDGDVATLKRVRKLKDSVLLEPLNTNYDPILINGENNARIIGKAIKVSFDL